MSLTDHALLSLRHAFASCAATTRSPLSATQRAAIIMALHDPQWVPTAARLPDTWDVVERWYAGVQGNTLNMAHTLTEEPHP